MRFLANENVPGSAVAALREAGNDVVWIRTAAPGSSDPEVLAWAARDQRILLTFDKDFGELAEEVGRQLAGLIMARADWVGHFSVVEPGRVRMRTLGKSRP